MESTFHKCVVNFMTIANPTQYTKLGKSMEKSKIRLLLGLLISSIFAFFFCIRMDSLRAAAPQPPLRATPSPRIPTPPAGVQAARHEAPLRAAQQVPIGNSQKGI